MHATLKELEKHGIVIDNNAKLKSGIIRFIDMKFEKDNILYNTKRTYGIFNGQYEKHVTYTIYKDKIGTYIRRSYIVQHATWKEDKHNINKFAARVKENENAYDVILRIALWHRKTHNVV